MMTVQNFTIQIQIPQNLHQIPIITNLVRHYELNVNIQAAVLDKKASSGGGWFNLLLQGEDTQIQAALTYLREMGVYIWGD
ncbi:MAG: NIL domain-containing protein [Synechococcales bacterium]|nr:NIL domain-containing protein [Synechococcales bacterium]